MIRRRPIQALSRTGLSGERSQCHGYTRWGVALVEVALGYEWLLSALNKLFSREFRSGLASVLRQSAQGNPNGWYTALLQRLVLPHASIVAVSTEIGELLIALGYVAGAALWLSGRLSTSRWARFVDGGIILALLGSMSLSVNYYLMAGNTLPVLQPNAPFQEGLSIDGLLVLVAGALLVAHVAAWRAVAATVEKGAFRVVA